MPQVRRPAQFTYLAEYNLSLKELGTLVNSTYMDSHISYCVQCRCVRGTASNSHRHTPRWLFLLGAAAAGLCVFWRSMPHLSL